MADHEAVLMQLVERSARHDQRLTNVENVMQQLAEALRDLAELDRHHIQTSTTLDQLRQDVVQLYALNHSQDSAIASLVERVAGNEPTSRLTTRIVFGMVGFILAGFIVALVTLVF